MKNSVVRVSSMLILAIILTVITASAQTFRAYRAEIPFDFTVGKKIYKAGGYSVQLNEVNQHINLLSVKDLNGRSLNQTVALKSGAVSGNKETRLIFNRYGNQYVLRKIAAPDFGIMLPKMKTERRIAKNFGKPDEIVAIVLVAKREV